LQEQKPNVPVPCLEKVFMNLPTFFCIFCWKSFKDKTSTVKKDKEVNKLETRDVRALFKEERQK